MCKISKRTTFFLLAAVVTATIFSSGAAATIFEVRRNLSGATPLATPPHQTASRGGATYPASIDHDRSLHFQPGKLGSVKPADMLWLSIGDARSLGLRHAPPAAKTSLHLVDAEPLLIQKTRRKNTVPAPTEGTAPEIWVVILIGAGLILSQLRRKARHGAIRLTVP